VRITLVADFRSPIAQGWERIASSIGHDISVISSRPLGDQAADASVQVVPLGPEAVVQQTLARLRGTQGRESEPSARFTSRRNEIIQDGLRAIAPWELKAHSRTLTRAIHRTNPDVVHALRLPFEAMATVSAWPGPVAASIWGNDLTLHAPRNSLYRRATRRTLTKVAGLHTDCHRDQVLAADWGFAPQKPTLVIPGSGGINTNVFTKGESQTRLRLGIPPNSPVVLNARGVRGYTQIPEFLDALELILQCQQNVHVLLTGMAGHDRIRDRIDRMAGRDRAHILPAIAHADMPDVHRAADVSLSLTTHDGTPNTLLEAMATGSFPIVSPVESVLEWIRDGVNGSVVSPFDSEAIANAVLDALDSRAKRSTAAAVNLHTVEERAAVTPCSAAMSNFYESVLRHSSGKSSW